MDTNELINLGFVEDLEIVDKEQFSSYYFGNENIGIEVTGVTLVELKIGKEYHTIPNCNFIDDIKEIIRLFNIKK